MNPLKFSKTKKKSIFWLVEYFSSKNSPIKNVLTFLWFLQIRPNFLTFSGFSKMWLQNLKLWLVWLPFINDKFRYWNILLPNWPFTESPITFLLIVCWRWYPFSHHRDVQIFIFVFFFSTYIYVTVSLHIS